MSERIAEQTSDYFSIHLGNQILNVDIENSVVTSLEKLGFDNFFNHLAKDAVLTHEALLLVLKDIRTLSNG